MGKELPEERSVLVEIESGIFSKDFISNLRAYQRDLACSMEKLKTHHINITDARIAKIRSLLMAKHHLNGSLMSVQLQRL